ncbi:LysE/ArgO family amino acid transporter [Nocardia sp. NPDC004068]|uniref:LysE/ArgO family amino acid transporter n=1 Tax=Nocardia sp. NPDC004068 TaxID=3364303 RepID=UPI0036A80433
MNVSAAALAALSGLGFGLSLIVAIGAQNVFVLRQGIRREHVLLVVAVCALSDLTLITAGVAGFGTLITSNPTILTIAHYAGATFLLAYAALALRRAFKATSLIPDGDLEPNGGGGAETIPADEFTSRRSTTDEHVTRSLSGNVIDPSHRYPSVHSQSFPPPAKLNSPLADSSPGRHLSPAIHSQGSSTTTDLGSGNVTASSHDCHPPSMVAGQISSATTLHPPRPTPTRTATLLTALALTWLNPHVYLDTVVLLGSYAATHTPHHWYLAAGAMTASILWFTTLGYAARLLRPLFAHPTSWRILDTAIALTMTTLALTLLP